MRRDAIAGALLGTAVGDALGLPREGLSRRRALRLFGGAPLRHRLVLGRGLGSDDTEHACMVVQALLAAPEDPAAFARSLGWLLRLADRLASRFAHGELPQPVGPLPLFWPGLLPRNLAALVLVLLHGVRRMLPPY